MEDKMRIRLITVKIRNTEVPPPAMTAYEEGGKAFYDGKDFDDNPYPITDPDNEKWDSGYQDADVYESGERS